MNNNWFQDVLAPLAFVNYVNKNKLQNSCMQLTKASRAETSCNQLLLILYLFAQDQFAYIGNVVISLYDIMTNSATRYMH